MKLSLNGVLPLMLAILAGWSVPLPAQSSVESASVLIPGVALGGRVDPSAQGGAHGDWSPRGDYIAFDANRDGEHHVFVVRPDGSGLRRVTPDGANHGHPAWSPDGGLLAFESDRAGDLDIWRIALDGTGLRQLTSGPQEDGVASWSPDGGFIVYGSTSDGNTDVFVVPSEGGPASPLTAGPFYDGVPRWSPVDNLIAFDTDRAGKREIWSLTYGSHGEPAPLVARTEAVSVAAWSPNGREMIVTIQDGNDPGNLFRYELQTGAFERLTSGEGWEGAASWSPSGDEIVFQRNSTEGWILEILDIRSGATRRLLPH